MALRINVQESPRLRGYLKTAFDKIALSPSKDLGDVFVCNEYGFRVDYIELIRNELPRSKENEALGQDLQILLYYLAKHFLKLYYTDYPEIPDAPRMLPEDPKYYVIRIELTRILEVGLVGGPGFDDAIDLIRFSRAFQDLEIRGDTFVEAAWYASPDVFKQLALQAPVAICERVAMDADRIDEFDNA